MDAPTELLDRAKELVRSLCSRNLIPGADLARVTVAIHDELCGASLAVLAGIALRKDFSCRGNVEVAIKSTGYELVQHLIARDKLKEAEMEEDPISRRPVAATCPVGLRSCSLYKAPTQTSDVAEIPGTSLAVACQAQH